MLPFLFLLLWILFASLQLTKIDKAFGSRRVIPVFHKTSLAAVFIAFKTFNDADGLYHPDQFQHCSCPLVSFVSCVRTHIGRYHK